MSSDDRLTRDAALDHRVRQLREMARELNELADELAAQISPEYCRLMAAQYGATVSGTANGLSDELMRRLLGETRR